MGLRGRARPLCGGPSPRRLPWAGDLGSGSCGAQPTWLNLSTSSRHRLQGVGFLAALPGSSSSSSSPSVAGAGGTMAGGVARTPASGHSPAQPRRQFPGLLNGAGGAPPTASPRATIGRLDPPLPMWPNPSSPREATNRKAPGQRPAGRDGDGARGGPSPPPACTALGGHLYSGHGGLPPRRWLCALVAMLDPGKGFTPRPVSATALPAEGLRDGRARRDGAADERGQRAPSQPWLSGWAAGTTSPRFLRSARVHTGRRRAPSPES